VDPVALGFLVGILAHLVVSLRRAYEHSWTRAVASGVGLLAVFNVILALWMLAVVGFAAHQAA
jgi:ABC-type multidrug transport system permease subunit